MDRSARGVYMNFCCDYVHTEIFLFGNFWLILSALEDDPLAVLQTMRQYIRTFFGCRECGKHFEEMAQESMSQVKSVDEAVLWLWRKHNQVNARLAGKLQKWNMDWWNRCICNINVIL